ncbi:MAG: STAS domain-containing protein [Spirochaetota bacterium]
MELQTEIRNEIHIVILAGRVDVLLAPDLKASLDELITRSKTFKHLCIDLSAVNFLDSTAMGVFINLHKTLRKSKKKFSLCAPQPQVSKLFDLSGLSRFFTIFNSRDDVH